MSDLAIVPVEDVSQMVGTLPCRQRAQTEENPLTGASSRTPRQSINGAAAIDSGGEQIDRKTSSYRVRTAGGPYLTNAQHSKRGR